uniref:Putative ovule protein n=1 Tax=Solanum chacoense TaxID=4108 RepID=A0A0V0HWK2_SOLCH
MVLAYRKSIRMLCNEFKINTKIEVVDGAKTITWNDDWHEVGNMEILFQDIYNLAPTSAEHNSKIVDTSRGLNFVFRGHLNDWEIPRVIEFFNTIDQFSGLKMGQDIL